MKKLALLALLPLTLQAEPVVLNLDNVSLADLVKVTYGDIEKSDYFIDDDLANHAKRFTIQADKLQDKKLKQFLDAILEREGFNIRKINSVLTFEKQKPEEPKVIPYVPKYRDAKYIQDAFRTVLPINAFGVAAQHQTNVDANQTGNVQTSGNSAYDRGSYNRDELLVRGDSKVLETFNRLINDIDRPIPEVSITAYIYEVNNNKQNQSGVQLTASILGDKLGFNFGVDTLLENFINIRTFGITAILSALNTDNRYNVVSSPYIRVADNKNASFNVGSDVPVLTSIVTNANGQSQQSIDYRSSGILLNVSPKIKTETIELKIQQELSNFIRTQTGVNNSPTLIKRSIDTVIEARDEDVIILGGLDENSRTASKSGLFFLPPLLDHKSDTKANSSIVVVMHVKRI